jgi:adenosylcobinamide-GDP ribazoletransferase
MHAPSFLADLFLCLRFCSRLPLPVLASERDPHGFFSFSRAAGLLPVAGGIIGALAALVLTIAALLGFPPTITALFALASLVLMTGALHEDGLADCADGFGGGTSRERKLDIMRDSRIGTFGTVALVLTLLLRFASLAEITALSTNLAAMVLIASAAISRAIALLPLALLPAARQTGLGFAAGRPQPAAFALSAALGLAIAFAPSLAGAGWVAILGAVVAAAGAGLGVTVLARQQISGHTGDVAGMAQQMSEIGFYLAFSLMA